MVSDFIACFVRQGLIVALLEREGDLRSDLPGFAFGTTKFRGSQPIERSSHHAHFG